MNKPSKAALNAAEKIDTQLIAWEGGTYGLYWMVRIIDDAMKEERDLAKDIIDDLLELELPDEAVSQNYALLKRLHQSVLDYKKARGEE